MVDKFNQNHDERGRFSTGSGASSGLHPGSAATATPSLRERLESRARELGIEHPENYSGVALLEAVENAAATATAPKPSRQQSPKPPKRTSSTRNSGDLPYPKKDGAFGSGDLKAVNPNFLKKEGYSNNCQRCVTAVELRQRGYDVTAEPKGNKLGGGMRDILNKWESPDGSTAGGAPGTHPVRAPEPGEILGMSKGSRVFHELPAASGAVNKKAVDAAVKKWGPGSRGFVAVQWGRRIDGSHIFNVENRNGRVVYMDGQSGNDNVGSYFSRVNTIPGSVNVVRVDDLKPSNQFQDWVRAA